MITRKPQPGERVEFTPDGGKTWQYAGTVVNVACGICYLCDETKPSPQSQREFWGGIHSKGNMINNSFIYVFPDGKMNCMHRIQTT